jgi:hypothetical protein
LRIFNIEFEYFNILMISAVLQQILTLFMPDWKTAVPRLHQIDQGTPVLHGTAPRPSWFQRADLCQPRDLRAQANKLQSWAVFRPSASVFVLRNAEPALLDFEYLSSLVQDFGRSADDVPLKRHDQPRWGAHGVQKQ